MLEEMNVEINIARLDYLLTLYNLSKEQLVLLASEKLQKPLTPNDLFSDSIKLSNLKRIDKIFNKGLAYYVDPSEPVKTNNSSIFFRKNDFHSELNLKTRKIITEFEDLKHELSAVCKVAEIEKPRLIPVYSINDNPRTVANSVRDVVKFSFKKNQKVFLEHLINRLAACNILVLEFVETWNQKEKANIDGVFLFPNVIVLKRLDGLSYKREIFTLAHELGHYCLNIEEIEKIDFNVNIKNNLSDVEQWCNSFAFSFLAGGLEDRINNLPVANYETDYNHDAIEEISQSTNLSRLAIYTQLLIKDRISPADYSKVKHELDQNAKAFYEDLKKKREEEKAKGNEVKGGAPSPIKSDLLVDLVRVAFFEGLMNEHEVCKTLKIQSNKIGNYIHF